MGMCRKAIYIYKKKRANSVIPVNYGSCQTWAAIRQYEKGLRQTRCYKSTDSHSALCCLTTSNLFLGFSFFFFKCNRAHVCTLLGITNRLKVVVEAGEEHLYAAWDEPGSAEGKTALVPSRWPAGAPPLTFFTGCLESILISLKPRLLCPQQGRGRNEQIVQGGRIKCEIEMSKIIHLNLPRHSFIA